MSYARVSPVRGRWAASLVLFSACTGVLGAPNTPQRAAPGDGGEVPPHTDIASRTPATADDAGPAPDGGVQRPSFPPRTQRSAGCGKAARGTGDFERRTVRIGERERVYHVFVPRSYDPARAYPLIFRFHGMGGDGRSGGLDIERETGEDAIVVAADGINRTWTNSTQAEDLQLFDTMLETLSASHCIDTTRVFSYGFSAGGGFTNLLGCVRVEQLRGTAAIAGFNRTDARCDRAAIAAWFQHDQGDPAVSLAIGRAARDRLLARNDCKADRTVSVDGCIRYTDCDADEPVIWCETSGLGHDIDGARAPAKVWKFFSSLP